MKPAVVHHIPPQARELVKERLFDAKMFIHELFLASFTDCRPLLVSLNLPPP